MHVGEAQHTCLASPCTMLSQQQLVVEELTTHARRARSARIFKQSMLDGVLADMP